MWFFNISRGSESDGQLTLQERRPGGSSVRGGGNAVVYDLHREMKGKLGAVGSITDGI